MSKHTPEPWYAIDFSGFHHIQDGPFYEDRDLLNEDISPNARANALRIVECVNALAGKPSPAEYVLRATELAAKYNEQLIEITDLKALCDELLASLEMAQRIILLDKNGYQHERNAIADSITKAKRTTIQTPGTITDKEAENFNQGA